MANKINIEKMGKDYNENIEIRATYRSESKHYNILFIHKNRQRSHYHDKS